MEQLYISGLLQAGPILDEACPLGVSLKLLHPFLNHFSRIPTMEMPPPWVGWFPALIPKFDFFYRPKIPCWNAPCNPSRRNILDHHSASSNKRTRTDDHPAKIHAQADMTEYFSNLGPTVKPSLGGCGSFVRDA